MALPRHQSGALSSASSTSAPPAPPSLPRPHQHIVRQWRQGSAPSNVAHMSFLTQTYASHPNQRSILSISPAFARTLNRRYFNLPEILATLNEQVLALDLVQIHFNLIEITRVITCQDIGSESEDFKKQQVARCQMLFDIGGMVVMRHALLESVLWERIYNLQRPAPKPAAAPRASRTATTTTTTSSTTTDAGSSSSTTRGTRVMTHRDTVMRPVLKRALPTSLSNTQAVLLISRIQNELISIIHDVVFANVGFAESLGKDDEFISFMLEHFIADKSTFEFALRLLEELLGARQTMFDLQHVANFEDIVNSLSDHNLALFCHVFSFLAFDIEADMMQSKPADKKKSSSVKLIEMSLARPPNAITAVDRNHDAIINIEGLLSRLIGLLQLTDSQPEWIQRLVEQYPGAEELISLLTRIQDFSDGYGSSVAQLATLADYLPPEDDMSDDDEADLALRLAPPLATSLQRSNSDPAVVASVPNPFYRAPSNQGMDKAKEHSLSTPHDAHAILGYDWFLASPRDIATAAQCFVPTNSSPLHPSHANHSESDDAEVDGAGNVASHHVELLFVLSALLGGKRKPVVQDQLARLGIVPALEELFRKISWRHRPAVKTTPLHGVGCECNIDNALKIQYLRVILNFCDRDSDNQQNKRMLLSETDQQIAAILAADDSWDRKLVADARSGPAKMVAGNRFMLASALLHQRAQSFGLMSQLAHIFIQATSDHQGIPCYKFWASSCIEAFARGWLPENQLFIAHAGVLEHSLKELLSGGYQATGLQAMFDLLGELIKFNPRVFKMLDDMLDEAGFTFIMDIVVDNLIDSNVFLRAIVLSLEEFRERLAAESQLTSSSSSSSSLSPNASLYTACLNSKLAHFITANRFPLTRDLISSVTVEEITQENVCCLNSALLFFIIANRHGELVPFTKGLREFCAREATAFLDPIENLKSLLWFWKAFYVEARGCQGKDCSSLEFSSRVKFDSPTGWIATHQALNDVLTSLNDS